MALGFMTILLSNKLLTEDSLAFSMLLAFVIFTMFLFTQMISYDEFISYYTKAMMMLCLYSLISTYTIITFVDFFNGILPSFTHEMLSMRFLDAGLSFIYVPQYGGMQYRNYSVFSEPGVFQFYINIALIFELWFIKDYKHKTLRITILIITLITTFSTAGILVGFLIILAFVIQKKERKVYKGNIRWVVLVLSLISVGCYIWFPKFTFIIDGLFVKLSGGASLNSRAGSFSAYLWAWFEKPIVGWGYEAGVWEGGAKYLSQYTAHNTNTIFTNFAFYGLFYGGMYFILFSKFIFNINAPIYSRILLFLGMMISINNERFIDNGIIFIIIFYTISRPRIKEGKNEFQEND